MNKMKIREIPVYEECEVEAKTIDSTTGTIDRKTIGRCLLTLAAGYAGKHEVVDGDGTPIVTVESFGKDEDAVKEIEVVVELVGGMKSLASYKFFGGYKAENRENPGVTDIFVEDGAQIAKIVACAERMCRDHSEVDGMWQIVEKSTGKRVFLRKIATNLSKTGKIED